MTLYPEVGTAKDNLKSPIHDWYKFTAGFSYKLIEQIAKTEMLTKQSCIFDPFAGCGTTLVSAQKLGIKAVGNEAQVFMYDIISAKLNWDCVSQEIEVYAEFMLTLISKLKDEVKENNEYHPLLVSLYKLDNLIELYAIKLFINRYVSDIGYQGFFRLALSQILHKVSEYVISAPYIVRGQKLKEMSNTVLELFLSTVRKMGNDIANLDKCERTSKIYLQDSRQQNHEIIENSSSICITSPPYLNNLDYGEVSKVHTCFWGITNNWNDVTEKVRKNLVTGSTTHYTKGGFDFDLWKETMPVSKSGLFFKEFMATHKVLSHSVCEKKGRKTFDILMCLYFSDMAKVLIEIKRVLKAGGKAYLIVGDSAPYGTMIPTTKFLGEISKEIGFNDYTITKIRSRGGKWSGLKHRHNKIVDENIIQIQ